MLVLDEPVGTGRGEEGADFSLANLLLACQFFYFGTVETTFQNPGPKQYPLKSTQPAVQR